MEVASSILGIIAFADLVAKYAKLVDTWREAPEALRRIREKLSALEPVVADLSTFTATASSSSATSASTSGSTSTATAPTNSTGGSTTSSSLTPAAIPTVIVPTPTSTTGSSASANHGRLPESMGQTVKDFAADVAALHALVDALCPPTPPAAIKLLRRAKWTVKKKAEAVEIEQRLDGYLRSFTMVLAIVQQ